MNPDSELTRFGLDGEQWLGLAREAQAPPDLGFLGSYRLIREVGRGGQAVVYEGVREPDGERVAVKRLLAGSFADPATLMRFRREIAAISTLSHPNIVKAEGIQIEDGPLILVMQWVDGVRVTDWARGKEQSAVLGVLRMIGAAVAHAHRRGVIHRDLKPANILVSQDGEPQLLDFGLAKWSDLGDPLRHSITRSSHFLGTPAYCSPEQIAGDPSLVDTRTDVYSLGVIAYDLLLGKPPYEIGGGLRKVMETITTVEPQRPRALQPGFDRALEAILLKMLAKDRDERYAAMELLLADLNRFERGDSIEARSLGGSYAIRKLIRKHRWPVAIAGAFIALLIAFGVTMALLYNRAELEERRVASVEAFLAAILAPEGINSGSQTVTIADLLRQASERLASEPIADPVVEGRLHGRLARTYARVWNWREVAGHTAAALAIHRELGDQEGIAQSLSDLGLAESFLGEPQAVAHLMEALSIVETQQGEDTSAKASVLANLAFAYIRTVGPSEFSRADDLYVQALSVLAEEDAAGPLAAGIYYRHAVLALEQEDLATAERRFRLALAIYDQLPEGTGIGGQRCREDYAKALAALGRFDDAREWLRRSQAGRPLDHGLCMTPALIAAVILDHGYLDPARPFLIESLKLISDYLVQRRPEHSTLLQGYADRISADRMDAEALLNMGDICRAVDAALFTNWRTVVQDLEQSYAGSHPDNAEICAAVLQQSEPISTE